MTRIPATALLPLRFFFGATFIYAGFDKLLDARFLDPSSSASIQSQMTAFARSSPIGGLVHLAQPVAIPIGLLIAVAEIGIGLGALSGLAFRVAAAGGAVLSLLFFLTASWSIRPFYLGPDLPYATGWLVLAMAGHGDVLVPNRFRTALPDARTRRAGRRHGVPLPPPEPADTSRRMFLETVLLAAVAVGAAFISVPLRSLGFGRAPGTGGANASGPPSVSTAPSAGPSAAPTTPSGIPIAKIADIRSAGAARFTVPFDAPAPLPAGDPGVVVRLANGTFVAFDAVCTHQGCTVDWDAPSRFLVCPCHGATFDPARSAAVVGGPTDIPLSGLPVVVDTATGRILLRT